LKSSWTLTMSNGLIWQLMIGVCNVAFAPEYSKGMPARLYPSVEKFPLC